MALSCLGCAGAYCGGSSGRTNSETEVVGVGMTSGAVSAKRGVLCCFLLLNPRHSANIARKLRVIRTPTATEIPTTSFVENGRAFVAGLMDGEARLDGGRVLPGVDDSVGDEGRRLEFVEAVGRRVEIVEGVELAVGEDGRGFD